MLDVDFKDTGRSRLGLGRRKTRARRWILTGLVCIGLGLVVAAGMFLPRTGPPASVGEQTPPPQPREPDPPLHVIEGRVEKGSTFFQSLTGEKIPSRWVELIISKLRPFLNFRRIKGGAFRFYQDDQEEMVRFIYEEGPTELYEITKEAAEYVARKLNVPLESRLVVVAGEIRSSLFEAMEAAGEEDTLAIDFAEVLAWEVDFYKDVREGDRFQVIAEKMYKGRDFIKYGPIHAVAYQGEEKSAVGIRFQDEYYDETGTSLRKAFLKSPLRFNRISSRFSQARKHPILGGVRPHYGVDYAAPIGTPVWAVADGTVSFCGWNGGYGKQVILKHMNGYQTHYGHLSRYGAGIQTGKRVKQKQVIGYVGSTGLSTGPHLDYRLSKKGQFRNPMRESFPRGVPIRKEEREVFEKRKRDMLTLLQKGPPDRAEAVSSEFSHADED
jgi:murein DD-endopeptidase MepM/ murein hydrolase activator NlpD